MLDPSNMSQKVYGSMVFANDLAPNRKQVISKFILEQQYMSYMYTANPMSPNALATLVARASAGMVLTPTFPEARILRHHKS